MTRNAKEWNQYLSALELFESRAHSKNQVFLYLPDIQDSIPEFEEKKQLVLELLKMFEEEGIIRNQSRGDILEYNYTNSLYRYCTMRVGNILEVKTLQETRAVQDKGRPYFGDCRMSVDIDWDGKWHKPEEKTPDTHNEIDVMVMHGMTPLFISCKNGNVAEELYKLNTVAERFGGPYARKMLIVADLERKGKAASRALELRARDMGIYLVTDAADLTAEEWPEIFKEAIKTGY
jgi:hypothetical protein